MKLNKKSIILSLLANLFCFNVFADQIDCGLLLHDRSTIFEKAGNILISVKVIPFLAVESKDGKKMYKSVPENAFDLSIPLSTLAEYNEDKITKAVESNTKDNIKVIKIEEDEYLFCHILSQGKKTNFEILNEAFKKYKEMKIADQLKKDKQNAVNALKKKVGQINSKL